MVENDNNVVEIQDEIEGLNPAETLDVVDDIDTKIVFRSTTSTMELSSNLFYKLYNLGIIEKGTTMVRLFDIGRKTKDYLVRDVNTTKDIPYIKLQDVENMRSAPFWITPEKINLIGGMTINDIFEAYEIRTDELPDVIDIEYQTDIKGAWQNQPIIRVQYQGEMVELKAGMKIIPHNDIDEKYNNRTAVVRANEDGTISVVRGRGRPKTNFSK